MGLDGSLSHRGLLRLMQEAAAIESDGRGYGLKDVKTKGVAWILAGWRLTRLSGAPWRAPVEIRTWPRKVEGFVSERDFLAFSGSQLLAKATSRWFLMDVAAGKITRVTPDVRNAYTLNPDAVYDSPLPARESGSPDAVAAFSTTVGRRDIDTNHHVNNIHYLDYAMEALPPDTARNLPNTVEALFRHQILQGTPVRCLYSCRNQNHLVEIQSGQDGDTVHHAYIRFYDMK